MQLLPAFTMSPRFKEIFESSFFSGSVFKIAILLQPDLNIVIPFKPFFQASAHPLI